MLKKDFWTSSASKLKETKYLAVMAVFIALKVMVTMIRIPVSENLNIAVSFMFAAIEGAIIGPAAGLVSGAVTDIVGYIVFPSGAFFPGYTLSSMAGMFVYGLFLFRQKITVLKIIAAKAVVNYCVNVLLGSLWSAMMFSKGYLFYAANSLIKNSLMLPIEVIILIAEFNFILPLLKRRKLIETDTPVPVPFR